LRRILLTSTAASAHPASAPSVPRVHGLFDQGLTIWLGHRLDDLALDEDLALPLPEATRGRLRGPRPAVDDAAHDGDAQRHLPCRRARRSPDPRVCIRPPGRGPQVRRHSESLPRRRWRQGLSRSRNLDCPDGLIVSWPGQRARMVSPILTRPRTYTPRSGPAVSTAWRCRWRVAVMAASSRPGRGPRSRPRRGLRQRKGQIFVKAR